ncbi:TonB C-terminal domain-containing protein, partial [Helicobacter ailurogastricus]
ENIPPLAIPPIEVDLIDNPPPSNLNPFESGLGVKDMFSAIPDKQAPETNPQEAKDLQKARELLRNIQFNKLDAHAFKDLQDSLAELGNGLKSLQAKKMEVQIPKEEKNTLAQDKAWFAAIYQILYSQWKLNFDQKALVGALITIYPSGQMRFSVVDFSPFREYNQQIESLLLRLQQQKFPPYPQGRAITLKVNFKTKDE